MEYRETDDSSDIEFITLALGKLYHHSLAVQRESSFHHEPLLLLVVPKQSTFLFLLLPNLLVYQDSTSDQDFDELKMDGLF